MISYFMSEKKKKVSHSFDTQGEPFISACIRLLQCYSSRSKSRLSTGLYLLIYFLPSLLSKLYFQGSFLPLIILEYKLKTVPNSFSLLEIFSVLFSFVGQILPPEWKMQSDFLQCSVTARQTRNRDPTTQCWSSAWLGPGVWPFFPAARPATVKVKECSDEKDSLAKPVFILICTCLLTAVLTRNPFYLTKLFWEC